jgi:hypothetical protein
MTKDLTPYDLAYHLTGVLDGDWDDGIERFVSAYSSHATCWRTVGGEPAHKIHLNVEAEDGKVQRFELIIIEKKGAS